jgi:hypothetical protein
MENISNIYQLLAFLIVAGLQVYTRWSVAQLAKKQDKINEQHDEGRAELLRLIARTSTRILEKADVQIDEVAEEIKAALKVSYLQGQADAGKDKPWPEDRAAAAARQLAEIAVKAVRNGSKGPPGSPPIEH